MVREFTLEEIAKHKEEGDLYMVIDDKVYDASKYVNEHPGGAETMLDFGGMDATEAFDDVGHSDEAREILETMLIGMVKQVDDPARRPTGSAQVVKQSRGKSRAVFAFLALPVVLGFGFYFYI